LFGIKPSSLESSIHPKRVWKCLEILSSNNPLQKEKKEQRINECMSSLIKRKEEKKQNRMVK